MSALREIIHFAKFGHKSEMEKWKDWALLVLAQLLVNFSFVPVRYLSALYSLYDRVEDYPTSDRVMKHWRSVADTNTHASTIPILEAGDECNDEIGLSEGYFILIRRWKNGADIFNPQRLA
ncbi:hypothetical protein C8R45DRAFT_1222859 [Mycena sanguinolenta]|nr:hypothetical protein C8R45DRAFT_1222859 [Mycena sanguinolenta]